MTLIPLKRLISKLQLKAINLVPKLTKQDRLVNPRIDEASSNFSYFSKPIMQLGCRGSKKATAITPEGYLYTGAIEIVFFTGIPLQLINQRIKTLQDGHYPLVTYDVHDTEDHVVYTFKMFQHWLKEPMKSPPINHVLITIKNTSNNSQHCSIGIATSKANLDHRPKGDIFNSGIGQIPFKKWKYDIEDNQVSCDNKLIFLTDISPNIRWKYKKVLYEEPFKNKSSEKPCCILQFDYDLKSNEEITIHLKVPHYPIPKKKYRMVQYLKQVTWEQSFSQFESEWKKLFQEGIQLEIPEQKVIDTSRSSLMFNLMCQEFKNEKMIQKVNRFQYNDFWLRDSSFFSRMYGIFGRREDAKRLLLNFLEYQNKEGNFLSQSGQLDGWGQALWAFGEYIQLYKDKKFAEFIFPHILKAIVWLKNNLRNGLMPSTNAFDNEMIMGKYTGHNFWALHGLTGAYHIAIILNDYKNAEDFRNLYEKIKTRLLKYLKYFTRDTKVIPPGLEFKEGIDWSNLLMVYPTKIFDLNDELVLNTLNYYRRHKMKEGLSTWGPYLHHYVTERIAISELMLNHQRRVLNDFYSMLLHTGSCNEGFEMAIYPWGNRDYESWIGPFKVMRNYPPHGWFACAFNVLLRMMLLREEDEYLHLISVLSPDWVQAGKKISIKNAQTRFGQINFIMKIDKNGYEIKFDAKWENKPQKIIIHKPFFVKIKEYFLDNTKKNIENEEYISLEPNNFNLRINWDSIPDISINYEIIVNRYKRNYKKAYQLVTS